MTTGSDRSMSQGPLSWAKEVLGLVPALPGTAGAKPSRSPYTRHPAPTTDALSASAQACPSLSSERMSLEHTVNEALSLAIAAGSSALIPICLLVPPLARLKGNSNLVWQERISHLLHPHSSKEGFPQEL